jgi:predicted nucleic acid-binding protein
MILVDTNVVSEPTKPIPDAAVLRWFAQQDIHQLYLPATSLAEMHFGVESLPDGRRKNVLRAGTVELIERFFGTRILPFDKAAALAYGSLIPRMMAKRKRPSVGDGQIAAIALVHGFAVATRDTDPFLAAGLKVINPWEAV